MSRTGIFTLGLLGIILVGGYITYNTFFSKHAGPGMGGGMPVSVAMAQKTDTTLWNEFSGRLEATDIAEVKARVSGIIEKIHFENGAMVKKDQRLFTIDPRPYAAEVQRAKGQVAAAQSAYMNAKLDEARAAKLLAAKAISQREYDERKAMLVSAAGNMDSAKGALTSAQLNLEYTKVVAPISGKASRAEITEGNMVNAGPGAPTLTTIVALSPLYASFDVDEQTYLEYVRGVKDTDARNMPVRVGLASETGASHEGHIDSFDNRLNMVSGTIRARAVLPNEDYAMVPGLFARVQLGTPAPQSVVLVNERAIGTDQDKKFVIVVDDKNIANYQVVTLGQAINGMRVVKSGLNGGERIVVNGTMRVMQPGMPVMPQEVDMVTLKPVGDTSEQPQPGQAPVETEPKAAP